MPDEIVEYAEMLAARDRYEGVIHKMMFDHLMETDRLNSRIRRLERKIERLEEKH